MSFEFGLDTHKAKQDNAKGSDQNIPLFLLVILCEHMTVRGKKVKFLLKGWESSCLE